MNTQGPTGQEALLTGKQRSQILSTFRLQVVLTLFVAALIVGLSALMLGLVTRIFDSVTPGIEASLRWKAERGAVELASVTDLGLVVSDSALVLEAASDYLKDSDVIAIVALDAAGALVVHHGENISPEQLLQGPPRVSRSHDRYFSSWAEASIEEAAVGRVAVAVSKRRLLAGQELKRQMQWAAAIGCGSALVACFLFAAAYITPLVRVTRSAFKRLEKTTLQALESTRLKSEFLANVSHELRTPMNGIIASSELVLSGELDEKQRKYTQIILKSGHALLELLDDILDLSKVEAGKLELRVESCDLGVLLEECRELLLPRAQKKGLSLTVHIDPRIPIWVSIDRTRLRQVLVNLMGNAVKFTESGSIEVICRRKDQSIELDVVDTGVGIAAEDRPRLFEVFSQVDGSYARKQGGTGLGLAISKKLVLMMGGEIGVDSIPGEGSTFWFKLPLEPAEPPLSLPPKRARLPKLSGAPHSRPRALLVEDNEINQQVMSELLTQLGYAVELAADGEQAVSAVKEKTYSVVLMDCQMPVMDGYRATREIRETLSNTTVPIVAVTAHAIVGDREKALSAGMDDYLTKPVTRAEVERALSHWVARAASSHPPEMMGPVSVALPEMEAQVADMAMSVAANDNIAELSNLDPAKFPTLDPTFQRSTKVIELFLKHMPPQLEGIAAAVADGNAELVRERAHKLKGGANAVGTKRLAELARVLEACPVQSLTLVKLLRVEYTRAEFEMRGLLRERGGAAG